ncbi:MAG: molybdopterin molybdotransferase MoeA [Lysobacterales bacterium]|jgi:molybdopterin molybdotransferase
MLSVDDAIAALLDRARVLAEEEQADLGHALGRMLAAPLVAGIDVPPADNSAMDGYAIRHADCDSESALLPISQRVTAGSSPDELETGTAARIFTGAEVPRGADTVVMQENCEASESTLRILQLPAPGANIRRRGQDIARGATVLEAGTRLRPQDVGLAASLGLASLPLRRRLRVAILSTGDELVEPGEPAGPGKIYNSNRYTMRSQLEAWGFEPVDLGVARDEHAAVRKALRRAASEADVVMTSGGVSVGEEDHVRNVVQELGEISLWRIAIKPGKPFAFGQVMGKPFLGLPGNPVSVFVTMLIVARPFLFACQGAEETTLTPFRMPAQFDKRGSSREDYLRVRSGDGGLKPFANQSSGVLFSTSWAHGLVRQRQGQDIHPGDIVDFFPFALFNQE